MVSSALSSRKKHHASPHKNASTAPTELPAHVEPSPPAPPPPPPPPAEDGAEEENYLERAMKVGATSEIKEVAGREVSVNWRKRLYKICLALAVLVPLAPSIALLVFIYRHGPFGGGLYKITQNYRSSTQVVVSIIVAILAYLNVFVISNLFRAVGIVIGENPVFTWLLHNIGLESDSSQEEEEAPEDPDQLDKDLAAMPEDLKTMAGNLWQNKAVTWRVLWVGGVCFALLATPHLVWTGALSPNNIAWPLPETGNSYIPSYSAATAPNWSNNSRSSPADCDHMYPNSTGYNACAAVTMSSQLFTDMSGASDSDYFMPFKSGSPFDYNGRSYGVGSSAGLTDDASFKAPDDLFAYSFIEPGYVTSVRCTKNDTSTFSLKVVTNGSTVAGYRIPPLFGATGRLPNSDWTRDSGNINYTLQAQDLAHTVAWAVHASADRQYMLAIAAGAHYSYLDKVQCTLNFTASTFNVTVDLKSYDMGDDSYIGQTVRVKPLNKAPEPAFDPDHGLALTVANQLNVLAQTQSNGVYSDIGEALTTNMASKATMETINAALENKKQPNIFNTNLTAIEDSIQAAADDILQFVAGGQYYFPIPDDQFPGQVKPLNSSTTVTALPIAQRVQIGDPAYNVLAMFLTALLVLLVIINEIVQLIWPGRFPKKTKQQSIAAAAAAKKKKRAAANGQISGQDKRTRRHARIHTEKSEKTGVAEVSSAEPAGRPL